MLLNLLSIIFNSVFKKINEDWLKIENAFLDPHHYNNWGLS